MKWRQVRLGVLMVLSVAALGARVDFAREQARLDQRGGLAIPKDAEMAVPSGYLADGLTGGGMNGSGCVVIRFVESTCSYCAGDRNAWNRLMGALAKLGCEALGVVPSRSANLPSAIFGYGAEDQLALTTMDWAKGYHPTIPPSVLVIGRPTRILWYRIGTLQPGDTASAFRAVSSELPGGTRKR